MRNSSSMGVEEYKAVAGVYAGIEGKIEVVWGYKEMNSYHRACVAQIHQDTKHMLTAGRSFSLIS